MTAKKYSLRADPKDIQTLIVNSGISVTELANRCGVNRATIYNLMNNGTCTINTAGKLCGCLGVKVSDVFKLPS